MPRSRTRGAIPPLPQYVFMAWCLGKYRSNFILFLLYISHKWQSNDVHHHIDSFLNTSVHYPRNREMVFPLIFIIFTLWSETTSRNTPSWFSSDKCNIKYGTYTFIAKARVQKGYYSLMRQVCDRRLGGNVTGLYTELQNDRYWSLRVIWTRLDWTSF